MATVVRPLIVEYSKVNAELLLRDSRQAGYAPVHTRVDTPEAIVAALDSQACEIVIADHASPGFDDWAGLKFTRERRPELPFIALSGAIGGGASPSRR